MLLRSMQSTRRSYLLKLKMMLCVMIFAAGRHRFIKAICQSVREATTASGVDNAALPPDWQTPLANRIISPSERKLITMQKQLEGTQVYINEQCR